MPSIQLQMPDYGGLAIVKLALKDADGNLLHSNFMHVIVQSDKNPTNTTIISQNAKDYFKADWSEKSWSVMDGLKVNGAGKGYFEYHIPVASSLDVNNIKESYLLFEASAKQLFDKDKDQKFEKDQDYMLGAKVSPHKNPNAYPMTDEILYPSVIDVIVNGQKKTSVTLTDDPADHRGVLSWNSQFKDKKLREAGSYGYLVKIALTTEVLNRAKEQGFLSVKMETQSTGGLAIYGKDFGRYPVDPSIIIIK